MQPNLNGAYTFSQADQDELVDLVNVLELSSGTKTIFAVAPESGPQHPVVQQLKSLLQSSDERFQFQDFFYSDNSLYNFLYGSNENNQQNDVRGRRLIMAFGIDQLPTPRIVRELKQLNLGREVLFEHGLVLIFWLNKVEFLEEFRNRAPDFWDWRGKVVTFEARPVFNPLFYPYLEWLIAENSYLKISGVMQVQRQVDIFLDQIYVSLQAVRQQQVTETSERVQRELEMAASRQAEYRHRLTISSSSLDDLDEPYDYEPVVLSSVSVSTSTKTVTQKVDLSQAVREHQYSVILGAPGAGKTTLLRYLARHFAVAKRDGNEIVLGGEAQEELGKPLLPVFFRIADYAERLDEQPDLSLLDYLRQFYRQWATHFTDEAEADPGDPGTEVAVLLLEQMRQGQCLMLLDGLDEVFDQESRRRIVERINQFVEAYSANKFVVTSRIAGYRDVKLSDRFAEFTIEDMGSEQVEQFLHRWCRTIEQAQQPEASEEQWQRAGDAQTREILDAIKANEGVKRLTANPLLLTILALIHRNGSRLPNRRVELYALAVKTLTEDWQLGKKLPDAPKVVLKESEVVELLAPLAYWMHEEKPSGLVTQAEVEEQLAQKLAELNDADPESDSVRQAVEQFLRKVRETTGLFVERAPGVYGFMHLTFEEYFAARHIANTDEVGETLSLIRSHLHEPRWNEPILLALGYLSGFFSKRVNKLVEQLFSNLEAYEPTIQGGEIKIKNASSPDAILIWSGLQGESATTCSDSELPLKDLLFAGQVTAEVEVNSSIRKKLIQKLVLTYLGLDTDFEDETTKQLLRLLRQIELFNQKGEVIAQLKQAVNDLTLSEEMRVKAQLAILYIACSDPRTGLVNCVTEIVTQLEPTLFCSIRDLVAGLGEEMTPALEAIQENQSSEQVIQRASNFLIAMSYIRTDNYAKAISLLEEITDRKGSNLSAYIAWALAICYQEKDEFDKAIDHYQECFEGLAEYIEPSAFLLFWRNRGVCHRLHGKYEQSIECFQQALSIARESHKPKYESLALYHLGKVYKEWGKYEQAVDYYQQSRDLYQQLGREQNVANQWFWLADCYRDWGKYEQAITHHQQSRDLYQQLSLEKDVANQWFWLAICYRDWGKYEQAITHHQQSRDLYQQLSLEEDVANQWFWLAICYRDWGKYEQAITHHQQSRDLYQQLSLEKDVANQWFWLAICYRDWGKYEQALECELKDLAIRQQLDDQTNIASVYNQLGHIYQAWGKYEQAIAHFQQSRDLYEQLGRDENVANQWYWLAICYRDWGKYEQAVECELKDLAIRQQLDDQPNIADAYRQLGRIYQAWGKYEEAIAHFQQSRDLYQQLGRDENVANQWYWLADCYRDWGKYEEAVECELKDLAVRQQLDDQKNIADAYRQLGRIYQAWGKYEQAIAYHQQSRDLYQQLDLEKNVANQWNNLANCYRDSGDYIKAIEYYQQSRNLHQRLGQDESTARRCRQIGSSQRLVAKNNPDTSVALDLLAQAEQNIRQAVQLNTAGDYKENLAYDYTALGLLWSDRLRLLTLDDPSLQEQIAQFEEYYNTGLAYLTELGQTVDRAEEALGIARSYLEINVLENLDRAEKLAHEALEVFQDYNRRKLEATARKLLGEIYLKRTQRNQPIAEATAHQFLSESLQIYRELDLTEKAAEVEQLMHL